MLYRMFLGGASVRGDKCPILFIKLTLVNKVKLCIAPVKPAPEGDGVFSSACWR